MKRCSENMQQTYRRKQERHLRCSSAKLLHIFRTSFLKNTSGRLLQEHYFRVCSTDNFLSPIFSLYLKSLEHVTSRVSRASSEENEIAKTLNNLFINNTKNLDLKPYKNSNLPDINLITLNCIITFHFYSSLLRRCKKATKNQSLSQIIIKVSLFNQENRK